MGTQQVGSSSKRWCNIPYEVDSGIGSRAHIGMIVASSDQTLSYEARAMLDVPGIALYESRVGGSTDDNQPLSTDLLTDTFNGLELAIRQVNSRRPADVVALGCTSAAMVIGPQELEGRVRRVLPRARVTDPFTGILTALRALGASNVAYVAPYPREIAEEMANALDAGGVQVRAVGTFHNDADASGSGAVRTDYPFISPTSIARGVRHVISQADVQTVVIACTQMRAAAMIDELERQTGKTVVSSNQALCWHALRLAGANDSVHGWGRLFETSVQDLSLSSRLVRVDHADLSEK